jgi:nucleoid-associated protein YgaU
VNALTSHLRELGKDSALPFRLGCPVCRIQHRHGRLEGQPFVSARIKAGLAAGVLALSATAPPPVAVAGGELPSEHEGQVAPEELGAPEDSAQSPDFDPGGPQVDLPVSVGPDDPNSGSEAPEALEAEPPVDPGPLPESPSTLDAPPQSPPEPSDQAQPTPNVTVPEAPVAQPLPAPTPLPPEPAPTAPAAPAPLEAESPSATKPKRQSRKTSRPQKQRPRRSPAVTETPEIPASDTVSIEVVTAVATPSPASSSPGDSGSPHVKPGDRVHVVQRGDSLWSIARALLGPDASVAEVAREVDRLWKLNRVRIGTGDPDLILPGTRLMLR